MFFYLLLHFNKNLNYMRFYMYVNVFDLFNDNPIRLLIDIWRELTEHTQH